MNQQDNQRGVSRRDYLKLSGLTLGGLAFGGAARSRADTSSSDPASACYRPSIYSTGGYSYLTALPAINSVDAHGRITPMPPLDPDEMRISFMGSAVPPYGKGQMLMSIFVQVGWVQDDYYAKANPPQVKYRTQDQFVFDCGTGSTTNYNAMNINYKWMDKVFISHLHADHMCDLATIYAFGASQDRKSPLFVFGQGPSGVKSPRPPRRLYDDGTKAFCQHLRESLRWQSEAFSFLQSSYGGYQPPTRESWGLPCDPVPVGDDPVNDAFAIIPIELDWRKVGGVAYNNPDTKVKITHFPVIHNRKGSMGYKLQWTPPGATKPLTMIYTSDTKPESNCLDQAINGGEGVDVFIHEMGVPPEIWSMKCLAYDAPPPGNPAWWQNAVGVAVRVQNSSHTAQGAFGYLLSQISPRPRLTVATHFPTNDDNVFCARESVRNHCPEIKCLQPGEPGFKPDENELIWSYDTMVLRVYPDRIEQRKALISYYTYTPYPPYTYYDLLAPKYANPEDQLDLTTEIKSTEEGGWQDQKTTYRQDGY